MCKEFAVSRGIIGVAKWCNHFVFISTKMYFFILISAPVETAESVPSSHCNTVRFHLRAWVMVESFEYFLLKAVQNDFRYVGPKIVRPPRKKIMQNAHGCIRYVTILLCLGGKNN